MSPLFGSDCFDYEIGSYRCLSNFDVKHKYTNEVVFQKASQPIVETQGTLAKIVEGQETNKVMEEVLGILPTIIVVLIGLIGLRKAWAFLVSLLRRS